MQSIKQVLQGNRGNRGETLTEVLVSVAIGGLALLMLAMAISASSSIAISSRTSMQQYYTANNDIVKNATENDKGSGELSIWDGSSTIALAGSSSIPIEYYTNEHFNGKLVVLYAIRSSSSEGEIGPEEGGTP